MSFLVLKVIDEECLKCIKEVEMNRDGFKPSQTGKCVERLDTDKPLENLVCGEYAISQLYYQRCGEPNGKGEDAWKACAFNETCAANCVKDFVNNKRDDDCCRGEVGDRLCVDYGIVHAYGPDACSLRRDHRQSLNIDAFAKQMVEKCGILDPPCPTESGDNISLIVAPVVTTSVAVLLAVLGFLLFMRSRRKRALKLKKQEEAERITYLYNRGLIDQDGKPFDFNYSKCSDDVHAMLYERKIPMDHVDLLEEIGKGQFGVVRKATLYLDNDQTETATTAVKMLRKSGIQEDDVNNLLREALIMSHFSHVNVLGIIGVVWEEGVPPLVVLPYMGKGSLLGMVKEVNFSKTDLLSFIVQISEGLKYLENLKFVHRDVALRNCLVSDLYVIKISDFGLTRDIYNTGLYSCEDDGKEFDIFTKSLPWKWLAPECLRHGRFSHKSDVWAFGILIWELYSKGQTPYPAISNLTVLLESLETDYRLSKPDELPEEIYSLMKVMWDKDVDKRPSCHVVAERLETLLKEVESDISYDYTVDGGHLHHKEVIPAYIQPIESVDAQEEPHYIDRSCSMPEDNVTEPRYIDGNPTSSH